jgi:hypothetical protein
MNLQQALLSQQLASAPSGQQTGTSGAMNGINKIAQALLLNKLMQNQQGDQAAQQVSQFGQNILPNAQTGAVSDYLQQNPVQPLDLTNQNLSALGS